MNYKAYTLHNYKSIAQLHNLSEKQIFDIEVVGSVLPFRTNNYIINELIDWDNFEEDALYKLTFPQKDMLEPEHYKKISTLLLKRVDKSIMAKAVNDIRMDLNPHPAGQLSFNIPIINGKRVRGIQHKYPETVLFFPAQGQSCHAYCTFCFRWPQFSGMKNMKFAMKEINQLIKYIRAHPEITDILFTGGDPMVMSGNHLSNHIDTIINAKLPKLRNIRIGTKALAFWPYRFLTDRDSKQILSSFRKIVKAGYHLTIMAHFSHPNELSTIAVEKAIQAIRQTGAQIRTQSPVLKHINDNSSIWANMWKKQVSLGLIPYYMFVARDTGAKNYFAIPIVKAWKIFNDAYKQVSGICRTVRGPSMSANPGKIHILGISEIKGEKIIALKYIQARNPEWIGKPFYAKYNDRAIWINELQPAFGEKQFFFEDELKRMLKTKTVNYSQAFDD